MWVAVLPRIRRQKFELFFYTHQLYFVFLACVAFFAIILPGVSLFLIDRSLRFFQSRQKARLVSARLLLLPCETVELNFSKSPGEIRIIVDH